MGKKNRSKKNKVATNATTVLKNNPFSGLDFSEVVTKEEPKEEPIVEFDPTEPVLSPADQALLDQFGEAGLDAPELDVEKMCRPVLKMRIEKKKRAGHPVTTLRGFQFDDSEFMMELVSGLRKRLGVGGVYRDGTIEFQGNQIARLKDIMPEFGFDVKEG